MLGDKLRLSRARFAHPLGAASPLGRDAAPATRHKKTLLAPASRVERSRFKRVDHLLDKGDAPCAPVFSSLAPHRPDREDAATSIGKQADPFTFRHHVERPPMPDCIFCCAARQRLTHYTHIKSPWRWSRACARPLLVTWRSRQRYARPAPAACCRWHQTERNRFHHHQAVRCIYRHILAPPRTCQHEPTHCAT